MRRAVALALAAALAGCGWHAGLEPPSGAETLAVTFPDNTSPERDLEIELARELHRAAFDRLALLPAEPATADLIVRGTILDYARRQGIRSVNNELLETGLRIEVRLELVRALDGEVLRTAQRATEAGFVLGDGATVSTSPAEPGARERVLRNLAEGLVLDLFRPVAYNPEPPDQGGG